MAGMTTLNCHAQERQNKHSFKRVLEEVYRQAFSDQEAADAQFALIEFFKLLNAMEQARNAQEQGGTHD